MAVIHNIKSFIQDTRADAIVEATILFPIVIMIFTAMALLAVYLPERAVLAQATQYAANAISIEQSDTWLDYSEERGYKWVSDKSQLKNVYIQMFSALGAKTDSDSAETIVRELDGNSILAINGSLEVRVEVENYIIYKEVTVTATRNIVSPVDLSLIGFSKEIPITVSSTAIVQDADEFVRNMDIVSDLISYLNEKYNLGFEKVTEALGEVWNLLGIG